MTTYYLVSSLDKPSRLATARSLDRAVKRSMEFIRGRRKFVYIIHEDTLIGYVSIDDSGGIFYRHPGGKMIRYLGFRRPNNKRR